MLAVLEQIVVLQDRDRRIAQLRLEKSRIPGQLAEIDERILSESGRLESLRQDLRKLETDRKKSELEAESKREHIAKYKTQLFQIKSNTEYQALLREIAKLEEAVRQIEDQELEVMQQAEEAQPVLVAEQQTLKELGSKAAVEKSDLEKRVAAIERELETLQAERAMLAEAIDDAALARYERLMRSKGDYAVVPVNHGNCGGCHLRVPAHQVHAARTGSDLTSCEYCGRLLYCPDDE